ncbi:MAG: prolipoprotein diacylglyceryl transferase [Ruminococcus sp.]|nr:prolipoprotein diacylglyceryl transferase [Ruminococcus sp.]
MATETVGSLDYYEIVFPKLGIDITIDSTAFTIGNLSIQWYGILIILGLVLAMIYAFSQTKHYGLNADRMLDAVTGGIIGGILGARAYYVLLNWSDYAGDWKSILNFRAGGLAIYGGIIGGLLVSCLVAKLRKVKILPLLDIVSIGFLLAQGIGRWGNFFNQEAFGTNTTSIFGMSGGRIQQWIDESYTSTSYYANFGTELDSSLPVHPCFLYESIWCLLGFILLAIFAKKIRKYDGQIFLIYIGWYGLERAFVESLRTDSLVIGNVRISQLLAILCVIASILLQIICGLRVKRMGVDYHMYKDTAESKRLMEEESIRYRRKKKLAEESTEESPEENTDTMEAIEEEFIEETVSNSETEITAQEENDETTHDQESDNDKNNKKE